MSDVKYLLDENVVPGLRSSLRQEYLQITVWAVGEPGAPDLGTKDPEILVWCEEHGFILVTNNRSSMPVHLQDHLEAGREVPGILILSPNMSIGQTSEELALIHGATRSDEYRNLILNLPIRY